VFFLQTNGSGVLSFAGVSASAGQVIQAVSATDSTERATSSTSFVTGANTLSVSITPSSASNKILILVSSSGYTGGDNTAYYTLYRGATNLGTADGITMFKTTYGYGNIGFMVFDSPSTTSATTYQVYMRSDALTVRLNYGQAVATKGFITALEIKG